MPMDLSKLDFQQPFAPLCTEWNAKIKTALACKHEKFQRWADEANQFYDGDHTFMWQNAYAKSGDSGFLASDATISLPQFRMSCNRVFEMVALYGPALYATNPRIQVTPQAYPEIPPMAFGIQPPPQVPMGMMPPPPDPMFMQYQQMAMQEMQKRAQKQSCAEIKQHYLNWVQQEQDKKTQARRAICEAIITGMSFLETVIYTPPGSEIKIPYSRYLSSNDVVFDPDAEYYEDIRWVAIRRRQAVWEVERKFQLPPGSLKGHLQTHASQSTTNSKKDKDKTLEEKTGKSFDLLVYWEVFSKCGIGDRLKDVNADLFGQLSELGDYCYCAVSPDVPYFLNIPTELSQKVVQLTDSLASMTEATPPGFEQSLMPVQQALEEAKQELFMRSQWPIPFWTDGGWPFSRLHFYNKPHAVYPVSLVKPGIGELRFINWAMSFLADKAAKSAHTYVGILKSAAEDFKSQVKKGSGPFTMIEISEITGKSIKDIISLLDAPQADYALYQIVEAVNNSFDKRTGLTELLYGISGQQMRSATEADVRQQNTSIRPEDMASQVEDFLSECAMKEMEAAEWFCQPKDVQPVLGDMGAMFWQQYIMGQPFDKVVRDFDYRVEAGSARKPNKQNRVRSLNEFGQAAMPTIQSMVMNGQVGPWNAFMADMGKALDLDPTPYLIQPPPPMQPQPQEQGA